MPKPNNDNEKKDTMEIILIPTRDRKDITKYSCSGYMTIFLKESWQYKKVVIRSVKSHLSTAERLSFLLRINGWDYIGEEITKGKTTKLDCRNCGRSFETTSNKCPQCGNKGDNYTFDSYIIKLGKLGAVEAHQHEVLQECYNDPHKMEIYESLQKMRELQTINDRIMLRRA